MADVTRSFATKPRDLAVLLVWFAGEVAWFLAEARINWAQMHVETYADAIRADQHAPLIGCLGATWTLLGSVWLFSISRANRKAENPNPPAAESSC
jgi:hypothetical protein